MKKGYTAADYVAFSLLSAVVVIAVAYVLFGWGKLGDFLVHPATAAWVQAIGFVAAILAAAAIARWQVTKAEKVADEQRRIAERARLLAIREILRRSRKSVEVMRVVVDQAKPWHRKWASRELEGAQAMIDRLPIFEVPDPAVIMALQNVQRCLANADETGRLFEENPTNSQKEEALRILVSRRDLIDRAIGICDMAVNEVTRPTDSLFPDLLGKT